MKFEINFYREQSRLLAHTIIEIDWMIVLPFPLWDGSVSHVNWVRAAYGLTPLPETD